MSRQKGKVVLNTGAEVSIIRKDNLNLNVEINIERRFMLIGIGDTAISLLVEMVLCVNGVLEPFHVV